MDKETIMQLLSDGVISNDAAAKYFPDLKESRDERIRQFLIRFVRYYKEDNDSDDFSKEDCLAWLEGHGESIDKIAERARTEKQRVLVTESDGVANIDWDSRSIQDVKRLLEYGLGYIKKLEKQDEPTEINSEFDSQLNRLLKQFESLPKEELASSLSFYLNVVQNDGTYKIEDEPNVCEGCNNVKGCVACVDGSEWAHIEEQDSAWSERDDSNLERAIWYIENPAPMVVKDSMLVFWLKSIKDRIQTRNAWKPSKEQIIALRWVLNNIPYCTHKEEISGLLDQINELKGE